ncbi:hypothetical protein vseg_004026 [Gypsophila vaccaria]
MNKEETEESTSSPSPPQRHPSPLPVSTGPDYEKYSFSRSSSLSPRVSPPGSSHTSAEDLRLMHTHKGFENLRSVYAPSSLSVDRIQPTDDSYSESTSCLKELLEWFVLRCCICCSWNLNSPSKLHRS